MSYNQKEVDYTLFRNKKYHWRKWKCIYSYYPVIYGIYYIGYLLRASTNFSRGYRSAGVRHQMQSLLRIQRFRPPRFGRVPFGLLS